jgi:glyoxylase-like metal-dependent hydrolase (beta-lactamase superfamily II)
MIVEPIEVGELQVNCFVLGCKQTRQAIVVDPGDNAGDIQAALRKHGLALSAIVATHAHFDHIMAAAALQAATGAPFLVHPADRPLVLALQQATQMWLGIDPGKPPDISGELSAGQTLTFGQESLEIRATPGHSPGGITLVHHAGRRALTGDALFAGSIGRTDLPGGDLQQLLASIRSEIMSLPDDYMLLPGHGPATTVGRERVSNPFLVQDDS